MFLSDLTHSDQLSRQVQLLECCICISPVVFDKNGIDLGAYNQCQSHKTDTKKLRLSSVCLESCSDEAWRKKMEKSLPSHVQKQMCLVVVLLWYII